MNTNRYKRQMALAEIGRSGQEAILNARILCIGAGGLGSPALLYLVAAGISHIGIAELDTVDESNLQRQVLYTTDAIGEPKAQEAKKKLEALNPEIEITLYEDGLTADNAADLFKSYDIILDGTDNFETKFLINDAAVKFGKPWVYGAIQGFDGQASVFNAKDGPCYRCLYPEKPKAHITNCAESGVIGAVAGLIGVTQALQVIQLITKEESFEPLIGKLWTLNTKTMQTRLLNIPKNPDCSACSENQENLVLSCSTPACETVTELTPQQTHDKSEICLIDVREVEEWNHGYIEGARHWALSRMAHGTLPDLPQNEEIILYCQRGVRSIQAAQILKAQGYSKVYSMSGGYEAWLQHQA